MSTAAGETPMIDTFMDSMREIIVKPMSQFTKMSCVLACASLCLSTPAFSEGRLKERIKERLRDKLETAPAPEATAAVTDKLTRPGDYFFQIQHGGLTRLYRVYIPQSYSPRNPAPLLVALHGGGGDMNYMAKDEYYGLQSKAEKAGFVLVFPNGYSKFQSGKLATWNAGNCCGDARDNTIDDVGFIRQVVKNVYNQMNIDRNKIFATGMSNGGMMSERLACEAPETFAAIASVAGTDNTKTCTPSRSVSVLNIHALNDTHVLYEGGAGKDVFRDESKVTDFTSVPETIARWVERNHCNPAPQRVLSVEGATCDLYTGCESGARVKLCTTDSGGHSWPGGTKPRGEATSKAISANDVMWDFFMGR